MLAAIRCVLAVVFAVYVADSHLHVHDHDYVHLLFAAGRLMLVAIGVLLAAYRLRLADVGLMLAA